MPQSSPTTETPFHEMSTAAPDLDALRDAFEDVARDVTGSDDPARRAEAVRRWDALRGSVSTWAAMAHLHFNQDTTDERWRREREEVDAFMPRYTDLELRVKRALLESPHRDDFRERFGAGHAFDLWECDRAAFAPDIQDDLVAEQKLVASYIEAVGGARIPFEDGTAGLSTLVGAQGGPDRARREAAARALWGWFDTERPKLDGLFDELVTLRARMARTLGHDSFVDVGYARKRRVDYDRRDVEGFRKEVLERVVPLCEELVARQAEALGVDKVMSWDEKVHRPQGAPAPRGDAGWMTARAAEMFDALHPGLSDFFRLMVRNGLLDLETRDGKAFGGFCTWFPDYGVPFVFANFNGTPGDARVFTHEIGHAFQRYSSRDNALLDYVGCTSESAEIHSMSLEFLCWPEMERFFGDDADDFRRQHLAEQLTFLPYGVAVDHFQHLVYENPDASPADRHALWKELEATYAPWRDYGDLTHPAQGGYWQYQRHVYAYPFYYIDYTLAATCALQFWSRARTDRKGAWDSYVELCARGGSLPFRKLVESAGLRSPFEAGCLAQVVEDARGVLGV